MCCLCGLCECVKLSFSRCCVYSLQVAMIVLAAWCIIEPREWTYLVLFKNGTNISISDTVHKVIADGMADLLPFGQNTTTWMPSTTMHPLVSSTVTVYWCVLLIVINLVGFYALLFDSFVPLVLYAVSVLAYLLHAINQYLASHSYLYIFDMAIFGTILVNVILVLIYDCICNCCCGKKTSSSEDVQPLGMKPHYNARLASVASPQNYRHRSNMYGDWYHPSGQHSHSYYI